MERYLDPKADLTFKEVFGEHPDLTRSFLNALLPLEAGEEIESIEYLPAELVPENPVRRFSIVDVRCRDNRGRQFIVGKHSKIGYCLKILSSLRTKFYNHV